MDNTELLALPYLMPAQAQKHVTHNEALRSIDALVQISLKSRSTPAPPEAPAPGDRYAVPAGATGAWAGRDGTVAAWQDGAWMHRLPREGWIAWCEDEEEALIHHGEAWQALLPDALQNLSLVGINAEADPTNRLSVASQATLLSHEGDSHRLKVNRATSADTASLLLQTDFVGNAELALDGTDVALKVSDDGSTWLNALTVDPASGSVLMPNTATIADISSVRYTDQFETTSTSYVAVPGLSVTVQPKSSASRFLVLVAISGSHRDSYSGFVRLMRNATEIMSGNAGSLTGAVTAFMDLGNAQNWTIPTHVNFGIDSPATTDPVTYAIEVKTGDASEAVYINRNHKTTYTSVYLAIPASTMIVMEISA